MNESDCNLFWGTGDNQRRIRISGDKTMSQMAMVSVESDAEMPLERWREFGHDANSVLADPLFTDPEDGNFELAEQSPARRIGFEPIDMSKMGIRRR